MNNAQRTGQRILALACPLAAALYVGTDGLVSNGQRPDRSEYGSRPQSSADRSKHSVQPYISASASDQRSAQPKIVWGDRDADPRAWIDGRHQLPSAWARGAFCGVIVNVLDGINRTAASSAHVTTDSAARC